MFDSTFMMKDQRSNSVSCHICLHTSQALLSGSVNLGECVSEQHKVLISMEFKNYFPMCAPSFQRHSSVWDYLLFFIMMEMAFYPAVALMYFFGVMKATRGDQVELNDGASMNVFCLFVLAQPLCLVIGGYTGMATYLLTALVSYNFLPWREAKQPEKAKVSKKTK